MKYRIETQTVTVSGAGGGSFSLIFPSGSGNTGRALGTVTAGSSTVSSLVTATGTATIKAGSTQIAGVSTSLGSFASGATISGAGIPPGTTVTPGGFSGQLILSAPATASGVGVAISSTGPAPFSVGQTVAGPGIPAGTTVLSAEPGALTLSQPAVASMSGATLYLVGQGPNVTGATGSGTLSAGSMSITNLRAAEGPRMSTSVRHSSARSRPRSAASLRANRFQAPGIPPGTKVKSVFANSLELSVAATASGIGVAISSEGPTPFVPGEAITGPGIPADTTILTAEPGALTISQPATASASAAALTADLGFNASASAVQTALETLSTVGAGNVE